MYEEFYGLKERPFNPVPDPRYLYPSQHHKDALAYLTSETKKGTNPIVFTGEIGTGKTLLLRSFLRSLKPGVEVVQVMYRGNERAQLLQMILLEMGLVPSGKDVDALRKELEGHLAGLQREERKAVLVIDEAQDLGMDALDEVLHTAGMEAGGERLVRVIISGLPELTERIRSLDKSTSEGSPAFHLERLHEGDVPAYIRHRITIAGGKDASLFPDDVMAEIRRFSRGTPRLINMICDALLLYGFFSGTRDITTSLLKEVFSDLFNNGEDPYVYGEVHDLPAAAAGTTTGAEGPEMPVAPQPGGAATRPGPLRMSVLVIEKNARMRVKLEERFLERGIKAVTLSKVEEVFDHLDQASAKELQILVADASFFFAKGGAEDREGGKLLDRIQSEYAHVPLLVTSTLPLTVIRTRLFQRGIPFLLYKPDLSRVDLTEVQAQFDQFFDELRLCLTNMYSQYAAIYHRTMTWLSGPQTGSPITVNRSEEGT